MDFQWLAFDISAAKAISQLCLVFFIAMVAICAVLLLTERSKSVIAWLTATVMVICVTVSFLSSTLYFWHFFYRV